MEVLRVPLGDRKRRNPGRSWAIMRTIVRPGSEKPTPPGLRFVAFGWVRPEPAIGPPGPAFGWPDNN